jgi:hypothetical protein
MHDIHRQIGVSLDGHLSKHYSSELDKIGLVLRVDGIEPPSTQWHESGPKRLRLARKRRYITVDICFQNFDYLGVSRQDVQKLMLDRVWQGIELCVARIKKEKIDFKEDEFRIDLMAAKFEIEAKAANLVGCRLLPRPPGPEALRTSLLAPNMRSPD